MTKQNVLKFPKSAYLVDASVLEDAAAVARKAERDAEQLAPVGTLCPTCKTPITENSHGWTRSYHAKHEHTSACLRRGGGMHTYCLVPCPTCSGDAAAKRQARHVAALFGDAHIPFDKRDWSFANYPSYGDQVAMASVKTFIRESLGSSLIRQRGLYLVGPNGACKTSLAISALQTVLRAGRSGVFLQTVEMFDILKASIAASKRLDLDMRKIAVSGNEEVETALDRFEATQGAKLLRLVKEVEWLVLDDLGVEGATKFVMQELYAILEARRSAGLYTIFTSNRDARDLALYWRDESGVFDGSKRIIDRLGEYCLTVPVGGPNGRMKKS